MKSGDHQAFYSITIHPVGDINVYQTDNPSNSSSDISLKTVNVNLIVMVEEKSENHQSHLDSSSGTMNVCTKLYIIQ